MFSIEFFSLRKWNCSWAQRLRGFRCCFFYQNSFHVYSMVTSSAYGSLLWTIWNSRRGNTTKKMSYSTMRQVNLNAELNKNNLKSITKQNKKWCGNFHCLAISSFERLLFYAIEFRFLSLILEWDHCSIMHSV